MRKLYNAILGLSVETRRRIFYWAAGAFFAATLFALFQYPTPTIYATNHSGLDWWLNPVETNSFLREEARRRDEGNAYRTVRVYASPASTDIWLRTTRSILLSEDGGRTWSDQKLPADLEALALASVDFVGTSPDPEGNADTEAAPAGQGATQWLVAGGAGFGLSGSIDRGETWTPRAGLQLPLAETWGELGLDGSRFALLDIALSADGSRGVAVGDLGVLLLWMGGQWRYVIDGPQTYGLRRVAMSDDGRVIAAIGEKEPQDRSNGSIIWSTDFGETWARIPLNDESSAWLDEIARPYAIAASGSGERIWIAASMNRFAARSMVPGQALPDRGAVPVFMEINTATAAIGYAYVLRLPGVQREIKEMPGGGAILVSGFTSRKTQMAKHSLVDRTWSLLLADEEPQVLGIAAENQAVLGLASGFPMRSSDAGATWQSPTRYLRSPAPWYWVFLTAFLALLALTRFPEFDVGGTEGRKNGDRPNTADSIDDDSPIERPEDDKLNVMPLVRRVAALLDNPDTKPPLTIAITGPWGSGKSSFMKLLQNDLEDRGFRTTWFNAWHHQDEASLLASLLEAIRQDAVPPLWSAEGMIFRMRLIGLRLFRFLKLNFPFFLVLLIPLALVLVFGETDQTSRLGLTLLFDVLGIDEDSTKDFIVRLLGPLTALIAVVGLVIVFIRWSRSLGFKPAKVLAQLRALGSIRGLQSALSTRHRFSEQFKDLTESFGARAPVIIIDDLDRCKHEQVVEVLEAVNFFVATGRCFVIFGMDLEPVLASVRLYFEEVANSMSEQAGQLPIVARDTQRAVDATSFAAHYLEKLVNFPIPVSSEQRGRLRDLIGSAKGPSISDAPRRRHSTLRKYALNAMAWALVFGLAATTAGLAISAFDKFAGEANSLLSKRDEVARAEQPLEAAIPAPAVFSDFDDETAADENDIEGTSPEKQAGFRMLPPSPMELLNATDPQLMLPILAVLGFLIWVFKAIEERPPSYPDSDEFNAALQNWFPVWSQAIRVPRTVKRFKNRLRFLELMQREVIRQQAHLTPELLVAIATLQQINPRCVRETSFSEFFEGPTGQPIASSFDVLPQKAFKALKTAIAELCAKESDGRALWPPTGNQLRLFETMSSGLLATWRTYWRPRPVDPAGSGPPIKPKIITESS